MSPNLDFARALFAPFMRNHEFSSPAEMASQAKISNEGSEDGKALEISEALHALRNSSQIRLRSQNIPEKEGVDSINNLRASGENISESAVRITTLKEKRPVILGPGHIMSGKLQDKALANHFENLSLRNGEHSSDVPGLIGEGIKPVGEGIKPVATSVNIESVNIRSESASVEKTNPEIPLEKIVTSDSRSETKINSRNHAELPDSEKRELPLSNNSILERGEMVDIRSNDDVRKAAQYIEDSETYKNLGDHTDIGRTENSAKNLMNGKVNMQAVSAEPNIIANNQELPTQVTSFKTEGLPTSAIEKGKIERPVVPEPTLQPIIIKGSNVADGRLSTNTAPQIDKLELHKLAEKFSGEVVGKQRHVGPNKDSDKSIRSDLPLDSDSRKPDRITEKLATANVRVHSEIEKNSLKISPKNSIEILMDNDKGSFKTGPISAAHPAHDLTRQDVDSNIISGKGDNIEPTGREVLIGSQIDKAATLNRSELLPKPVSVSNFNSDIQETIVGQLTNSSKGSSKFTVALFPENFGKISIEISYSEAAGLKINMIGDNPEATKILEQNLPSLRENLQNEKLSELIVNLNSNKDSHNSSNKNGQPDGESFAEGLKNEKAALESEDSNARERDGDLDSDSSLDTYV
jgi:flagellar hook-length control protein FliK